MINCKHVIIMLIHIVYVATGKWFASFVISQPQQCFNLQAFITFLDATQIFVIFGVRVRGVKHVRTSTILIPTSFGQSYKLTGGSAHTMFILLAHRTRQTQIINPPKKNKLCNKEKLQRRMLSHETNERKVLIDF